MKTILPNLFNPAGLSRTEAAEALTAVISAEAEPSQIGAFISIIETRGITQNEFEGFIGVLSDSGKQVDLGTFETIDVCGTGGDGKGTFNISTAAAFILAGSGVKVAKHGNKSATSGCGSSDVLEHLGLRFTDDEATLRSQLEAANFTYLHAPLFQPALRNLGAIRSSLGFKTFFNMIGPLLNPARPRYRFAGVSSPLALRQYQYFLETTDCQYSVVFSRDGYDEISLTSSFEVVTRDGRETLSPEDVGFPRLNTNDLIGGHDVATSADLLLRILGGKGNDSQNSVTVINAAFARKTVTSEPINQCIEKCRDSLESGRGLSALETLLKTQA
jgi:anthranilate phosphoribosyltransferase